ncbi:hypothetical protein DdX_12187 [Ditylenchus destructor]|uniref:Uncharacterized protein n=1 Tax=Ditylenchus destructor TaxID=166010 RepID=A0AAD4MZG0_9BILA|nr:hypothetical protein DdX_12187 [Ditylenchus destructor]
MVNLTHNHSQSPSEKGKQIRSREGTKYAGKPIDLLLTAAVRHAVKNSGDHPRNGLLLKVSSVAQMVTAIELGGVENGKG